MDQLIRTWLFPIFFFIISHGACSHAWESGYVYQYEYAASMAIGNAGASGQHLESQLSVHAVDVNQLLFKLNNVNVTGFGDADSSSSQQLENQFVVFLRNGTVQSLAYPFASNVDQWAVNVHKGIASLFSVRYPEQKDSRTTSTTYTLMEEEVTGQCANVYDWTPSDGERSPSDMQLCNPQLHNRYQLVKTRDFDKCTHLPIYNLVAPAGWRCRPGSAICENVQSRSLIQRFDICGDLTGEKLDIIQMDLREDWISQPWGVKNHQIPPRRVNIRQKMTLMAKQQNRFGKHDAQSVSQRKESDQHRRQSLIYTFEEPKVNFALDDNAVAEFLEDIKELRSIMFQPTEIVKRKGSSLRKRLLIRFHSLSPVDLTKVTDTARRLLTPPNWSFYVQQMASVGSSWTLDLVKELMEKELISNEDIMSLISGFSMFLRNPSDHVLGQLLSLLDLKVVRSEPDLRQTAMVSLASFFRLACIDRSSAESRFPSQYLNTSLDTWPARLVTRLAVEIRRGNSGDRSAALSAFNILGHPSLIPVIIPLIEGKADSNPAVRTKAVLALHKLAHHGHVGAIKILHTVYANPSDNYQVRLAAFTLLMLSCPPDHVWQSVAARTWFEPRSHVASFVFTTFDTLASFRSPLRFLQKLSLKAKKVLKMTKPVIPGRSANYIWSYEKRRRLLASYLRLETFANKASVFPKEIYGRLNFNMGAVDFDFVEFEIHGHHLEAMLDELLDFDDSPCRHRPLSSILPSAPGVDSLLARLNVTLPFGELGEGFFHYTIMESIEKFWSFDGAVAKSIRGYLGARSDSLSSWNVDWIHQLPLVNVEIRWANSLGLVTEVRVTGQITATLHGFLLGTRYPMIIDSRLNPTVTLEVESSIEVQWSGGVDSGSSSSSNSSVLLLASLPGRIRTWSTNRPVQQIDVTWSVEGSADHKGNEFIFLHKSHCVDGLCPGSRRPSQLQSIPVVEWEKMLAGGQLDWEKVLSAVSFSWLPDENMVLGWQQLSWQKSNQQPTVFQFSVQLNRTSKPLQWVMTSGTSDLRRTSQIEITGQEVIPLPEGPSEGDEVTQSQVDRRDLTLTPPDAEEDAKRLAKNSTDGRRSTSDWHTLPTQIGRTLLDVATGRRQLFRSQKNGEQREDNHLVLQWQWIPADSSTSLSGHQLFTLRSNPAQYAGECLVTDDQVITFDGVVYHPHLVDKCHYMLVATTGTYRDKLVILLERGSSRRNQVLKVIISDDVIEIDLVHRRLAVNRVAIPPLPENGNPSQGIDAFSLVSPCHGPLLHARNNDSSLEIELPFHGLLLDIGKDIGIRARPSLGGQVQGLCGDMNGERLFEFRGPSRCVLSSGSLMAAQYQTSEHCSASATIDDDGRIEQQQTSAGAREDRLLAYRSTISNCPRQEGSPTAIKLPIDSSRPSQSD